MKKTLKKIAIILLFSFSATFIFRPAFAGHRSFSRCCGTTERWGRGGKWETKDSSASNTLWPIVVGGLGLGVLIYLFKNGPSFKQQEPQKIYIQPKSKNEENQEYGKKFNYNPSREEINPSEASDGVVVMEESNENFGNNSENNNEQDDPSLITGDRF